MGFFDEIGDIVGGSLGMIGGAVGGPVGAIAGNYLSSQFNDGGTAPQTPQQAGGAASKPNTSVPDIFGSDMGGAYTEWLQKSMEGEGGIPDSVRQSILSRAQDQLSGNAQASKERLRRNLSSRGLLRSGIMGQGLTDIETERQRGAADVAARLAEQEAQQRQAAQQVAASKLQSLAALRESALQAALDRQYGQEQAAENRAWQESQADDAAMQQGIQSLAQYGVQLAFPPAEPQEPQLPPPQFNFGAPSNETSYQYDLWDNPPWEQPSGSVRA